MFLRSEAVEDVVLGLGRSQLPGAVRQAFVTRCLLRRLSECGDQVALKLVVDATMSPYERRKTSNSESRPSCRGAKWKPSTCPSPESETQLSQ